jgi:hypothetical protein
MNLWFEDYIRYFYQNTASGQKNQFNPQKHTKAVKFQQKTLCFSQIFS